MIVVVIISLLASLAVPSFKKARLSAHASQYLAERKVIANAIEHYRAETGLDITHNENTIPSVLFPYLPMEMRIASPKAPFGGVWYVRTGAAQWYGINDDYLKDTTALVGLDSVSLATVQEILAVLITMNMLGKRTFNNNNTQIIYFL